MLNARQDQEEAEVIARAGERGRITVATNMAGRGTDIRLAPGVADLGGLHVLATERHDARRIDRQLFGRGGRQGDPGSYQVIVSLEDEIIRLYLGPVGRMASPADSLRNGAWGQDVARGLFRLAQFRAERVNAGIRRELLKMDEQLGDLLAFSGRGE